MLLGVILHNESMRKMMNSYCPKPEKGRTFPPRGRGFHHEGWVGELRERHRGLWPGDGGWIESDGTDVQVMNE